MNVSCLGVNDLCHSFADNLIYVEDEGLDKNKENEPPQDFFSSASLTLYIKVLMYFCIYCQLFMFHSICSTYPSVFWKELGDKVYCERRFSIFLKVACDIPITHKQ